MDRKYVHLVDSSPSRSAEQRPSDQGQLGVVRKAEPLERQSQEEKRDVEAKSLPHTSRMVYAFHGSMGLADDSRKLGGTSLALINYSSCRSTHRLAGMAIERKIKAMLRAF
jgi:hypothetical protein